MTSPYMNLPDSVAADPDALVSLRSDCAMNDISLADGIEQRIKWARDQLADLVALRIHPETADAFDGQIGALYSLLSTAQFLASDVKEGLVHERANNVVTLSRSPSRPNPHEAA